MSANQPASRGRANSSRPRSRQSNADDFEDAELDDSDLMTAANGGFEDIDDIDEFGDSPVARSKAPQVNTGKKRKANVAQDEQGLRRSFQPASTAIATSSTKPTIAPGEPRRLPNGNWECLHACTDKTSCRHLCCREGTDKKPRPSKKRKLEMEQQAKEAPKNKSSPINDFFRQGKKDAAPAKTVGTKITRPPLNDGLSDDFGAADMDETVPDPFEEDLFGSRRPSGNTAKDQRGLASTAATKLRPSHAGIFLTSSPDRRAVETVNLSGETDEHATTQKQASRRGPENLIPEPELDNFDDFGDEGFDALQENEVIPRHVPSRARGFSPAPEPSIACSSKLETEAKGETSMAELEQNLLPSGRGSGPFAFGPSGPKKTEVRDDEGFDAGTERYGESGFDLEHNHRPAGAGVGHFKMTTDAATTDQSLAPAYDMKVDQEAERLKREDEDIKQWLKDEFGDCVEFV